MARWLAMGALRGIRTKQAARKGAPMPSANNPRVEWARRIKALHVMVEIVAREVAELHEDMLEWTHDDSRNQDQRVGEPGPSGPPHTDAQQEWYPKGQAPTPDTPTGRW